MMVKTEVTLAEVCRGRGAPGAFLALHLGAGCAEKPTELSARGRGTSLFYVYFIPPFKTVKKIEFV